MTTKAKRACLVCNTLFDDSSESCPVCALRGVLNSEGDTLSDANASTGSDFRFEHYQVPRNEDGTPIELRQGAMGGYLESI